jgi:hypothetical protein
MRARSRGGIKGIFALALKVAQVASGQDRGD